jgi:hypothetical protein
MVMAPGVLFVTAPGVQKSIAYSALPIIRWPWKIIAILCQFQAFLF